MLRMSGVLLLGLAFLLVACGGEEEAPTPSPVAGVLPSPTPAGITPTVQPTPTPTPVPPPSPTPTAPAACTAPAAPNVPSGTLVGQGCVILNIPAMGEAGVNAAQLAGANIACAGARSTNGWQVWLPPGASVTVLTAVSTGGGPTPIGSGNSGTAAGYCGSIFIRNPGNAPVTVHVNWKMWDCTAGTCQ